MPGEVIHWVIRNSEKEERKERKNNLDDAAGSNMRTWKCCLSLAYFSDYKNNYLFWEFLIYPNIGIIKYGGEQGSKNLYLPCDSSLIANNLDTIICTFYFTFGLLYTWLHKSPYLKCSIYCWPQMHFTSYLYKAIIFSYFYRVCVLAQYILLA